MLIFMILGLQSNFSEIFFLKFFLENKGDLAFLLSRNFRGKKGRLTGKLERKKSVQELFAHILERVRVATGPSIGAEPEGPAPGPGGDILRLRGGGCGVTGTDSHPPQVRSYRVG